MKCPYCNQEMEKGFVTGLGRISFSMEYRRLMLYPKKGEITIAENTGSIAHKIAWLCKNCGMIVMRNINEPEVNTRFFSSGVEEDID